MTGSFRFLPVFGAPLLALALGACSQTTYGTGTSAGLQTVQDLTGITTGTTKQEAIAYQPRPELVMPPSGAPLPPPSSGQTVAANWPNDPDELSRQVKLDAAAREAAGVDPNFTLPVGTPEDPYAGLTDKEREELAMELLKQAKAGVSYDENGNPVRRYLIEPPNDYLAGDDTVPIAIVDEEKKGLGGWKWPWQWFSGGA